MTFLPEDLAVTEQNPLRVYANFKREEAWKSSLNKIGRLLSVSFIAAFLFLLFRAHYMESPILVFFNYLALYTGISGLLLHKFFEIPGVLLPKKGGPGKSRIPLFFSLSPEHREEILSKTLKEMGRFPIPKDLSSWEEDRIFSELPLENRVPWRTIGKWYFIKYVCITTIGGGLLLYQLFFV